MVLGAGEEPSTFENLYSAKYSPTPVCVWPPFVWIVSNGSMEGDRFNCSPTTCFYALCWNASVFQLAVVARLPRYVPIPVEAPSSMTLLRPKRDFGITAAIAVAITAAAVGATVSAVSLSGTVQTASALNNLSANVSHALDLQTSLNSQIKGGLMIVNQRIDLVQEQLDTLWQLAQLGCEWKMPGLCVTSVQYTNYTRAAELVRSLSAYLFQNRSLEFEDTLKELRLAVVNVNSTRVDLSLATGLSSWLDSAMDHLKEWAGLGALTGLLILVSLICLWCIYKIRVTQKRDAAMIAQAFIAIEAGQSPQVWLAAIKS
ncbi:Envelope glycoprotein [Cricetulus griseus]|uniref:Envelope glycoprotein n=1 Tax=Cricetulus griseus TaxID=10029 RepID=G3HPN4_CRIGR|nr:Envelope glycoprotein [Cricetulus griseus]